mmetsp:Transcript_20861/g.53274  ORF Transcript_20861/g.53274 Transcript_20861/m.53274 type:complete len:234 (-) Transcript_20861:205-906(-)
MVRLPAESPDAFGTGGSKGKQRGRRAPRGLRSHSLARASLLSRRLRSLLHAPPCSQTREPHPLPLSSTPIPRRPCACLAAVPIGARAHASSSAPCRARASEPCLPAAPQQPAEMQSHWPQVELLLHPHLALLQWMRHLSPCRCGGGGGGHAWPRAYQYARGPCACPHAPHRLVVVMQAVVEGVEGVAMRQRTLKLQQLHHRDYHARASYVYAFASSLCVSILARLEAHPLCHR